MISSKAFISVGAVLFVLSGCGDSNNNQNNMTIGPEGGSFTTDDGVSMVIPEEALSQSVTFFVEKKSSMLPSDFLAFTIGPSGTTFEKPVTLTIPIDEWVLEFYEKSQIEFFLSTASKDNWELAENSTINETEKTITGNINHLSEMLSASRCNATSACNKGHACYMCPGWDFAFCRSVDQACQQHATLRQHEEEQRGGTDTN